MESNHASAVRLDRTALQPHLKNYYEKKKSRGTGKAIIALTRTFLGIIYRTLKNRWVFADFTNFVLAEEATA